MLVDCPENQDPIADSGIDRLKGAVRWYDAFELSLAFSGRYEAQDLAGLSSQSRMCVAGHSIGPRDSFRLQEGLRSGRWVYYRSFAQEQSEQGRQARHWSALSAATTFGCEVLMRKDLAKVATQSVVWRSYILRGLLCCMYRYRLAM